MFRLELYQFHCFPPINICCSQEAAEIIECAYNNYANAQQRAALVEEFYGPSFALFKVREIGCVLEVLELMVLVIF